MDGTGESEAGCLTELLRLCAILGNCGKMQAGDLLEIFNKCVYWGVCLGLFVQLNPHRQILEHCITSMARKQTKLRLPPPSPHWSPQVIHL